MPNIQSAARGLALDMSAQTLSRFPRSFTMARPPTPERRGEILEMAIAYLAQNGLANLTMRSLASSINATTSVISYQFGSKEKLIEAALARARTANLAMLEDLRSTDPNTTVAQ